MTQFFREEQTTPVQAPTTPMVPGEVSTPSPAQPPAAGSVIAGRWLTPENTSLLSRTLRTEEWELAWTRELQVGSPPVCLQVAGDRVLIQCTHHWELVAAKDGEHVALGKVVRSDLLVDPAGEVFYLERTEPDVLAAYRMSDGKEFFSKTLAFGGLFERTHLSVLPDGRLAVAGIGARIAPNREPENLSGIEVWSLGDPPKTDGVGILLSAQRTEVLTHKSRRFLVAQHAGAFVIAVPGALAFADADLNLTSVLTAEFALPEQLSVDLAGRIHLFVSEPTGDLAYWLLSAKGELLASFPWSRETDGTLALPPVVGTDHRPYLISERVVRALDAEGKLLWESEPGGKLGGAAVSGDGRLLVAAGAKVSTYEVEGGVAKHKVLASIAGVNLTTAPILTPSGKLLVASQGKLHCLAPK